MPEAALFRERISQAALIGRGFTSEVYAWAEGRVLKLFHPGVPRAKAEHEFKVTALVRAAGVACPRAFEVLQMGGQVGIVFERIEGVSMFDHFRARPWMLFRAPRELAELHAATHNLEAPPGVPSQREQMWAWFKQARGLESDVREAARAWLERAPDGNRLCHGDFHPANVLLAARGPVVIDWSRAARGSAIADVARTCHLILTAPMPAEMPAALRVVVNLSRRVLHARYVSTYFKLRPGGREELREWEPVQRAAMAAWEATRWNHEG